LAATVKARDLNRLADRIRNTDYSINGSCQHRAPFPAQEQRL